MKKVFSLILCLLACVITVSAQKRSSGSHAERELKRAEREWKKELKQFEKEANARAARWEREERATRTNESAELGPIPSPVNLPVEPLSLPVTSALKQQRLARKAGLSNPHILPPFTVTKLPDAYKKKLSDPHRATNPRKVRERRARGHEDNLKNQYMFPVRTGAVVYDAQGKKLGRLAPTVRLNVNKVKQQVPQQIRINKNEEHRLKLRDRKPEKFEMAVGVKLTNGRHVSGLIRRADIPASDRPKQAPPKKLRAPKGDTIPFAITGGGPFPPPTLVGTDPDTGKRVPLKFKDPNKNPPRGFVGPHQEGNDYLPRPIGKSRANDLYYVNVLRSLPGRGGIARGVVKIDRKDRTPPIIDIYTSQSARSRNLYLPGRMDPKTSLIFLKGRLRGAGRDLGPVFIATPNLSNRVPPRRP